MLQMILTANCRLPVLLGADLRLLLYCYMDASLKATSEGSR